MNERQPDLIEEFRDLLNEAIDIRGFPESEIATWLAIPQPNLWKYRKNNSRPRNVEDLQRWIERLKFILKRADDLGQIKYEPIIFDPELNRFDDRHKILIEVRNLLTSLFRISSDAKLECLNFPTAVIFEMIPPTEIFQLLVNVTRMHTEIIEERQYNLNQIYRVSQKSGISS